ncbi:MAG: DUF1217 domain-containing protein, partial [Parvularculaceae bacterium]|nr:DUF1217 domain-containing protein [Parvularculaceae bacterium]
DKIGVLQALGQRPVREFLSTALGVPSNTSRLDVDKQQEIFKKALDRVFGDDTMAVFKDPEKIEAAVQRFFALKQLQPGSTGAASGFSAGLTLLQNANYGGANLLLSQT